jgi:MoxR-like ATPase
MTQEPSEVSLASSLGAAESSTPTLRDAADDVEPLDDVDRAAELLARLRSNVETVFRGKERIVRLTVASLVARGHLLLQDVPGVGKTTLALAVARSIGVSFRRIQFTSDLLPSDIIGVSVYASNKESFEFRPGPIFSNVVLADEINRTTPRTQSALLEAMSEGSVSVDNVTHGLPDPFMVIATQNPLEHHGTYPLPESQLDRFLMRLSIGYPGRQVEKSILTERGFREPVDQLEPVLESQQVRALQRTVAEVQADESIVEYILDIVEATRRDGRVRIGVSTRGALSLLRAARALALVDGRGFVIPDDVRSLIIPCLAHRLALSETGEEGERSRVVLEDLAGSVSPPS